MKIAIRYFLFMTLVLGVGYPILMTGLSQVFFPDQANGSLIKSGDKTVGSILIAQPFKDPKFFWPRPSAVDYNPTSSGASNLGPTSADLQTKIAERKATGADGDLLFASGSGLDPHISPESARLQIDRVAKARSLNENQRQAIVKLIESNTESRQFAVMGEPRVNVLKVNLALSKL